MRFLVDTNVLVRMIDTSQPRHEVCKAALTHLTGNGHNLFWCAQVMIEFWTVTTRPTNVNGLGRSPRSAEADLKELEEILTFLPEPPDVGQRWRALVNTYAVEGKLSHDTRLVAFMEAHGLTDLLTFNVVDFKRFTQIKAVSPTTTLSAGDRV